jgi:hypothetical protein
MKKIIIVACLLTGLASCYNDKSDKLYPAPVANTCDTIAVSFSHDIMPILNASCNISGGCHDAAGQSTSGYDFSTYDGIQPVATYGVLVNDINGTPTSRHNAMPKTGSISACDKNKFTAWVNQGSKNN